jgi:AcrR family transcriptional regulator
VPSAEKPTARRRRPVQDRSRQTVAAILEAAARIFDRGTTATTGGIARLAGVSIGSLYEYFPNKDAILESLVDRHVDDAVHDLRRTLAALPPATTPLATGVRRLVDRMLELHADRPGLHRLLVGRVMTMPAVRRRLRAVERRLRDELAEWLRAQPEVVVPNVPLAVRVLVEGTDALVHRWVEDAEGTVPETFAAELTRLWVGYLRGG